MSEIQFIQRTIAPAGRNKYGNYMSSGNITKSVVSTTYAGNDTTTTIADTGGNQENQNPDFYCMLSQTNATFTGLDLSQGVTANTVVIAYKGYDKGYTYVCDMDSVTATTDSNGNIISLDPPANMGIRNLPAGITVTFQNNGTTATTINFAADSLLTGNTGSILIPVCVYKRSDNIPEPDDIYNWYEHKDDCEVVWLEWVWNVNRTATSSYILDLSNQMAQVNCDTAGTLYSNSIATLQCTATTYYNGAVATGVTYSASTQPAYAAVGYSINANTGVMSFTSAGTGQFYWYNAYPALPIDIKAIKDGQVIATKTMTITRNYPGSDGTPAHTRYIVTDYDVVQYDPNTSAFTPTKVVGRVMLQVGDQLPVYDSASTIYQWYDDLEQYKTSASGTLTASTQTGISSITFALKNGDGDYYEVEDVPVISAGKNGTDGNPGSPGASGASAWHLTLSNDNASINCDSDGNILANAIRPSCEAKLYYGATKRTSGVTYGIDYGGASGVTSSVTSGTLTLIFGSNFNFTGSTVSITVSASTSSTLRDVKVMNISKVYAGEDGEPAINYWLTTSFSEVIYDPNTRSVDPGQILVAAFKQIGQQAATSASDATIKYSWGSRTSPGSFTTETDYSGPITVTSGNCVSYNRLRIRLYVGLNQVDQEDIDIMMNGLDGQPGQGRQGAAIRGPYLWDDYSGSTRCWCSGTGTTGCDDCDKWIDVIYKDGTYYYCNTTYYGSLSPWNNVKSNWTSGDTFDFIATNLLLAENAKIKFLSGNEIYMMDGNNVTGGLAGGTGITIWSGADSPSDAPFWVDYEGNLYAKNGTFAGYIQFPYTFVSDLTYSASTTSYYADGRAYLVSDVQNIPATQYGPAKLVLPAPTSGLNGFTYDIIVEPVLSRMDGSQQLITTASDGSDIFCYAYAELRVSNSFTLTGGRYVITCMPKHINNTTAYRWAITQSTGGIEVNDSSNNTTEYVSNLVATSYDTNRLVNKVLTYTGNSKPTVPNPGNTMYVKM